MDALQRWLARRRASGIFAGVVVPLYVSLAALAVAIAVGCALWKGLAPGAGDGCSLHVGAALSGSSDVFEEAIAPGCSHLTPDEARETILWDFAFIVVYAPLATGALWWLWPRAFRIRRVRKNRWIALVFVPVALFDLVENAFVFTGLRDGPSLTELGAAGAAVAGWWKWMLVAAGSCALVLAVCGAIGNRRVPPPPVRTPVSRFDRPPEGIGICLSGGGIRSAGFALGALRALDRKGILSGAQWVTAVSGGAYTAGAWHIAGGADRVLDPPPGGPSLFEYLKENRRYLSTGRGGVAATFLAGLALVAFNVLVLTALVCLASWPVGRLAASWAVQPALRDFAYSRVGERTLDLLPRLWWPGVAGFVVAFVLFVVSLLLWDPARSRVVQTAAFFAGGGTLLLVLLVVVPFGLAEVPKAWEALAADPVTGAGLVSVWLGVLLVATVVRLILKPFAAKAARLGGVLLALLAFLLAGRVATDAAYGLRWFSWSPRAYSLGLASLIAFYAVADAQSWSLFKLYWLRLRSTFATTTDRAKRARHAPGHAGVYPVSVRDEPQWAAYSDRPGPRLVVCAAAQCYEDTVTGVRALSFTFSDDAVALRDGEHDSVVRPSDYARLLRAPHLSSVSTSVAVSGAAFTSAMGRHSLGTTNALLAALNVRLGRWMPNPRYAASARPLRKPRLGYLLKEIFGVYDLDDPYLYVTDGGHWENLGLVELLRRRAEYIFCVDASGDRPDSFATIEEAIVMARMECGVEIELDPAPLRRRKEDGRLPKTAVMTAVIRYHSCGGIGGDDCPTGLLIYGKAMLAQDSPINTLSFSLRDRIYPRYPTYDQFLSEDEFMNLVRLGEWIGRGLALDYERFRLAP